MNKYLSHYYNALPILVYTQNNNPLSVTLIIEDAFWAAYYNL